MAVPATEILATERVQLSCVCNKHVCNKHCGVTNIVV